MGAGRLGLAAGGTDAGVIVQEYIWLVLIIQAIVHVVVVIIYYFLGIHIILSQIYHIL